MLVSSVDPGITVVGMLLVGVVSILIGFLTATIIGGAEWMARTIRQEIRCATQPERGLTQESEMDASEVQNVEQGAALLNTITEITAEVQSEWSRAVGWIGPKLSAFRVPFKVQAIVASLLVEFLILTHLANVARVAFKGVELAGRGPWMVEIILSKAMIKALAVLLTPKFAALAVTATLGLVWIAYLCKSARHIGGKQDAHEESAAAPSRVSHADMNRLRMQDTQRESIQAMNSLKAHAIQEGLPAGNLIVNPTHDAPPSLIAFSTAQLTLSVGELSPLSEPVDSASPIDALALLQDMLAVNDPFLAVSGRVAPLLPPMALSSDAHERAPSPFLVGAGALSQENESPAPPSSSLEFHRSSEGSAAEELGQQAGLVQVDDRAQMEMESGEGFGEEYAVGNMEDEAQDPAGGEAQTQQQASTPSFSLGGKNGDQADQLSKRKSKKRAPRQRQPQILSEQEMERKYDEPEPEPSRASSENSPQRRSARKRRKTSVDGAAVASGAGDEKSAGAGGHDEEKSVGSGRSSGRKRGRSVDAVGASPDVIDLRDDESDHEEVKDQQDQDGPIDHGDEEEEEKEHSSVSGAQAHSGPSAIGPPVYATRSVVPRARPRVSASHSPQRRAPAAAAAAAAAGPSPFDPMRRRSMDDGIEVTEYFALS